MTACHDKLQQLFAVSQRQPPSPSSFFFLFPFLPLFMHQTKTSFQLSCLRSLPFLQRTQIEWESERVRSSRNHLPPVTGKEPKSNSTMSSRPRLKELVRRCWKGSPWCGFSFKNPPISLLFLTHPRLSFGILTRYAPSHRFISVFIGFFTPMNVVPCFGSQALNSFDPFCYCRNESAHGVGASKEGLALFSEFLPSFLCSFY